MKYKNAILHLICNIPNVTSRLRAGQHPEEELNNGDTDICISIPERKTGCPRDKSTRVKDVECIHKGGKIRGYKFLRKIRNAIKSDLWN